MIQDYEPLGELRLADAGGAQEQKEAMGLRRKKGAVERAIRIRVAKWALVRCKQYGMRSVREECEHFSPKPAEAARARADCEWARLITLGVCVRTPGKDRQIHTHPPNSPARTTKHIHSRTHTQIHAGTHQGACTHLLGGLRPALLMRTASHTAWMASSWPTT